MIGFVACLTTLIAGPEADFQKAPTGFQPSSPASTFSML
jgi:hypothetical protein